MLLYEHPLSSYAQKVKIALREKGLDFDVETPHGARLGQGRRPVRRRQPAQRGAGADRRRRAHLRFDHHPRISRGQVSLAAAAAARSGGARQGAHDRGCLRHALRGDQLGPERDPLVQARRGRAGRGDEGHGRAPDRRAAGLADRQARHGRDWFNGDSFGWADLSVAPYVNRSFHYGLGTPDGSPLARWRERIRERPVGRRDLQASSRRPPSAWAMRPARLASGAIRREYRDHRLEWMMKSGGVQIVLDGLAKNNIRFTWPLG